MGLQGGSGLSGGGGVRMERGGADVVSHSYRKTPVNSKGTKVARSS